MNEKDGFDKIVGALEHQNLIIHRDYHIKYHSGGVYVIHKCNERVCFNILLFIYEIGKEHIKEMKMCKNKIFVRLRIKEVRTHEA